MNSQNDGLLFCARYAVAPNFFGYCGPAKTENLLDHLEENIADGEVFFILSQFETMYPYLQLIARKNHFTSPFDCRAVEAYWLGNSYLKAVDVLEYQALSAEKLFLDKKLKPEQLRQLKLKINRLPFFPHHAFHVFNIFRRTGQDPSWQTVETMDKCRIGWGKVKMKNEKLIVETKILTKENGRLKLTNTLLKEININYKGKQFIKNLKVGDWISFHWDYFCDILTEKQVKNLEYYTKKAIEFYNEKT